METNILSDVELFYSQKYFREKIILENDELHHAINVMRHKVDDIIYITDGKGNIAKSKIVSITKTELTAIEFEKYTYQNVLSNLTLCIPHIKKQDRLEFALEKSVELGYTKFIIYDSERAIAKGDKTNRWEKILLSAMKQSLRSWLPKVEYKKSLNEIISLKGRKILFDQKANEKFSDLSKNELSFCNYLIFGPEGGFSEKEKKLVNDIEKYQLTYNRLRSETAIVVAASLISITLTQ